MCVGGGITKRNKIKTKKPPLLVYVIRVCSRDSSSTASVEDLKAPALLVALPNRLCATCSDTKGMETKTAAGEMSGEKLSPGKG